MTQKKILQTGKDFIVVKDFKVAEDLSKSEIPSLKGKYIIVAPDGLEFVDAKELLKLPQILQLFSEVVGEDEKPDEYMAKHLTESELEMATNAVKFHARNQLRAEYRKAFGLEDKE